ncbi:MAG: 23S rRNA (adenine(2503)-C(2))-methyltransferase RlmN [Chloroflexota bacterium]
MDLLEITPTPPMAAVAPPTALPLGLDLDAQGWVEALAQRGLPAYRARQVFDALHRRRLADWSDLSELPRAARDWLGEHYRPISGALVTQAVSRDGTRKRLVRLADGQDVETVAIPSRSPAGSSRLSVCVSTQAGCAMACTFCATGDMGLARNLSHGEIVDQVYGFGRDRPEAAPTHVVFMGMGEPLANYAATVRAVRLLSNPQGANISPRRITVSTSGLVPQIRRLATEDLDITLAISLHAPNDDLRTELMPVNTRFPISALLAATSDYARATKRRVSYEYVMLEGVNDQPLHAAQLAAILPKRLSHVNLIPYNATGAAFRATPPDRITAFQERLTAAGVSATIRASRGRDIAAACGQLKAENSLRRPG